MAIRIRSKLNEANDYLINVQAYEGGILSAIEVTTGNWCPIIVYDDAVSIGVDKLEVQTPKVVSDLFWAYDTTFVADTRINPVTVSDLGGAAYVQLLVPVDETIRYYTTANSISSTATYKVVLNNPNNYKVQFATNVAGFGTVDGGGYPLTWVTKEPVDGFYLIQTICSDTLNQTIWMRYERSGVSYSDTYRMGYNFPFLPTFKTGIETIPTGGTSVVASGGYCLIWGNSGEVTPMAQGTDEEERWMISQPQFRDQAPFYTQNISPTDITVNTYNYATGEVNGTATRSVTVKWVLDDAAMDLFMEYLVRSGLQGFGILHYANDTPLGLFRQKFRGLTSGKRRGAKAFHIIGSLGGGATYTESINNIVTDVGQSWYLKVEKGGNQVPVFMALIDTDSDVAAASLISANLAIINEIKTALGITVSYNVLMTTGADIGSYVTGTNWDAKTNYYTYGEYGVGFPAVAVQNRASMAANASSKKLVPMISAGLDSRARYWLRKGTTDIGFYAYDVVINTLAEMVQDVKGYFDAGNSKFWMAGVGDENTEQGKGLFPTINAANVIDDRAIEKFRSVLNPSYVNPVI